MALHSCYAPRGSNGYVYGQWTTTPGVCVYPKDGLGCQCASRPRTKPSAARCFSPIRFSIPKRSNLTPHLTSLPSHPHPVSMCTTARGLPCPGQANACGSAPPLPLGSAPRLPISTPMVCWPRPLRVHVHLDAARVLVRLLHLLPVRERGRVPRGRQAAGRRNARLTAPPTGAGGAGLVVWVWCAVWGSRVGCYATCMAIQLLWRRSYCPSPHGQQYILPRCCSATATRNVKRPQGLGRRGLPSHRASPGNHTYTCIGIIWNPRHRRPPSGVSFQSGMVRRIPECSGSTCHRTRPIQLWLWQIQYHRRAHR